MLRHIDIVGARRRTDEIRLTSSLLAFRWTPSSYPVAPLTRIHGQRRPQVSKGSLPRYFGLISLVRKAEARLRGVITPEKGTLSMRPMRCLLSWRLIVRAVSKTRSAADNGRESRSRFFNYSKRDFALYNILTTELRCPRSLFHVRNPPNMSFFTIVGRGGYWDGQPRQEPKPPKDVNARQVGGVHAIIV
jgi:hypothetical protein